MQPVQESYVWNLRKRRLKFSPFPKSDFYKTTETSHITIFTYINKGFSASRAIDNAVVQSQSSKTSQIFNIS